MERRVHSGVIYVSSEVIRRMRTHCPQESKCMQVRGTVRNRKDLLRRSEEMNVASDGCRHELWLVGAKAVLVGYLME